MRAVVSPHAQCRVPEHSDAQTKQATPAIKVASESDLLCSLLLHMELRDEDLAVQHEIGLLPAVHDVMCKLHGWDSDAAHDAVPPSPRPGEASQAVERWGKADAVDSKNFDSTLSPIC